MSGTARVLFLSAVALVCLTRTAAAQEEVDLALKFTPGEVMDYDITVSGSGGVRAPDGEVAAMGLQASLRLQVSVAQVLPDGNARLQLVIPNADVSVTMGAERARLTYSNGRVRWYANGQEKPPPDADLAQVPILGVPLEFLASPRGQILDVVLPAMPDLAEMAQVPPGLRAPQLKDLGEPMFPERPVKVGETWRRSVQMSPLGPAMPLTVTSSRTLDSYTEQGGIGLAKISGYTEARLRASPMTVGPAESGVTVSMPEMRETITSTEFLNPTEGRLVRAHYAMSFVASISFAGAEQGPQEAGVEARLNATIQAR